MQQLHSWAWRYLDCRLSYKFGFQSGCTPLTSLVLEIFHNLTHHQYFEHSKYWKSWRVTASSMIWLVNMIIILYDYYSYIIIIVIWLLVKTYHMIVIINSLSCFSAITESKFVRNIFFILIYILLIRFEMLYYYFK